MKYYLALLIVLVSAASVWPADIPKIPDYAPMEIKPVHCPEFLARLQAYDTNNNPADGAELAVYGIEEDTVFLVYGPGAEGKLEKIIVVLPTGVQEFGSVAEAGRFYPSLCDALEASRRTRT